MSKLLRWIRDWIATLEVMLSDKDGVILAARERLRRGEGMSGDEFMAWVNTAAELAEANEKRDSLSDLADRASDAGDCTGARVAE